MSTPGTPAEPSLLPLELVRRESPAMTENVTHMTILAPSPSASEPPPTQIFYIQGNNGTKIKQNLTLNSLPTSANRTLAPKPPGLTLAYHSSTATKKLYLKPAGPAKLQTPSTSSHLQNDQDVLDVEKHTAYVKSIKKLNSGNSFPKGQEPMEISPPLKHPSVSVIVSPVIQSLPSHSFTGPPTSLLLNKMAPVPNKSIQLTPSTAVNTTMISPLTLSKAFPLTISPLGKPPPLCVSTSNRSSLLSTSTTANTPQLSTLPTDMAPVLSSVPVIKTSIITTLPSAKTPALSGIATVKTPVLSTLPLSKTPVLSMPPGKHPVRETMPPGKPPVLMPPRKHPVLMPPGKAPVLSTVPAGKTPGFSVVPVGKSTVLSTSTSSRTSIQSPTTFKLTPPPALATAVAASKLTPPAMATTVATSKLTPPATVTTAATSKYQGLKRMGKLILPRSGSTIPLPTQVGSGQGGGMISLKISNGQIIGYPKTAAASETSPLVPPSEPAFDPIVIKQPRKPNIIKSSKSYKQPESLFPNATFTSESTPDSEAGTVALKKTIQEPQQTQDLSQCLQEAVDSMFSGNQQTVSRTFDTVEATFIPDAEGAKNSTTNKPPKDESADENPVEGDVGKTQPNSPSTISSVTKSLDWSPEGVGVLPESNIKFCVNEFGLVELMDGVKKKGVKNKLSDDDDDAPSSTPDSPNRSPKKPRLMKKSLNVKSKDANATSKSNDDICCCKGCGCYGLASEYPTPEFCSELCKEEYDYNEQHRKENESQELLLKEKRRQARMEQIMKQKILKQTARIAERNLQRTLKKVTSIVKSVEGENESESEDTSKPTLMELSVENEELSKETTWSKGYSGLDNTTSESEEDAASSVTSSIDVGTAGASDGKPRLPWQTHKTGFSWIPYLTHIKAQAAPLKLFKDQFQITKNGFKVGMRMEGIDPEHASLFCVLTVADVVGFRLKLHFDGYSDRHDFWVNADSQDIFPCGWCERNNRILQPPFGCDANNFNIISYLKQCRALYAPRNLFYNKIRNNITPNGFRLGMKLEAVDQQNTSLVCVATVADILDNRVLVHFDGWDDVYNYWADPTSSYIHPVGWCKAQGHVLTPPNNYQGTSFNWDDYLKETKSQAAPIRAFKPRQTDGFRAGMRLECVDRRNPSLVRVACVDDVREHQIRIKFDGWSDIYSYWVDEDSRDIHPMSWCHKVGHHLEPPLITDDPNAECPTLSCKGQGHVQGSKHMVKHTVVKCPYDPQNLMIVTEEVDRLTGSQYQVVEQQPSAVVEKKSSASKKQADERKRPEDKKRTEEKNKVVVEEKTSPVEPSRRGRPPKWRTLLPEKPKNRPGRPSKWRRDNSRESSLDQEWTQENERKQDKRQQKKILKQKAVAKRNMELDQVRLELQQAVMNPGYEANAEASTPFLWEKHSHALNAHVDAVADSDMTGWNLDQVVKFVASVPGCESFTGIFKENSIDGEALSMITQHDLVTYLGIKLGPAIKLYNSVVMLRQIEKSSSL